MAEAVIIVCDGCGAPAADTVSIKVHGRSLQKNLCTEHLKELVSNARPARRGRPRGKPTTASNTASAKRPSKTGARQLTRRRRGRPLRVSRSALRLASTLVIRAPLPFYNAGRPNEWFRSRWPASKHLPALGSRGSTKRPLPGASPRREPSDR